MGCFENLLKALVPNGLFWKPSENTGSQWGVLATSWKHWFPMGCTGQLLKTLVPNGLFWQPSENSGSQLVALETF
jgi:hypothetical protein